MRKLHPEELEDELFLAMLRFGRKGAGPEFDLQVLCEEIGLEVSAEELLAFTTDHDGIFGQRNVTFDYIRFSLNADGRRHALGLEQNLRPLSLSDRLAADKFQKIGNLSISALSLLISLGALLVAIIALSKGS